MLMNQLPGNEERFQNLVKKIQISIVQVFYATFRLAVFYTVWICTAHKIMNTTLVFLPSILGGLLAIAPLLSPYLVCFIGMAELYLGRGLSHFFIFSLPHRSKLISLVAPQSSRTSIFGLIFVLFRNRSFIFYRWKNIRRGCVFKIGVLYWTSGCRRRVPFRNYWLLAWAFTRLHFYRSAQD